MWSLRLAKKCKYRQRLQAGSQLREGQRRVLTHASAIESSFNSFQVFVLIANS
jgi:hypothetical protein